MIKIRLVINVFVVMLRVKAVNGKFMLRFFKKMQCGKLRCLQIIIAVFLMDSVGCYDS